MPQRFLICMIVALALAVAFLGGRATSPSPAQAAVQGSHQATLDDVVAQLKLISADDYQLTVTSKQICKAVAGSKFETACK
jgi:hypothetical protein